LDNDDAAIKIIYLALGNAEKKWKMPLKEWTIGAEPIRHPLCRQVPKALGVAAKTYTVILTASTGAITSTTHGREV
jgi:hypothetical protein